MLATCPQDKRLRKTRQKDLENKKQRRNIDKDYHETYLRILNILTLKYLEKSLKMSINFVDAQHINYLLFQTENQLSRR
jgi:hypothetical protein